MCLSQLVYLLFILLLLLVVLMVLLGSVAIGSMQEGLRAMFEIRGRLGYEPQLARVTSVACPHGERRPWPVYR